MDTQEMASQSTRLLTCGPGPARQEGAKESVPYVDAECVRFRIKRRGVTVRHSTLFSAVLLACLYPVVPAHAAIVFQLTGATGVEQNNFLISSIGQTLDIDVYLKQTGTDTVLTDEGLFSAGVKLTYDVTGIAEVLAMSDITPNPAFDDPTALLKDMGIGYVTLDMAADMFGPNFPVFPQLSTPDRIWLGTFTFTGLILGTVQITAMDNPSLDNTLTGLGTLLDPDIGNDQGTITVTPEPSSLLVFFGLALVVGPFIWRHRRR